MVGRGWKTEKLSVNRKPTKKPQTTKKIEEHWFSLVFVFPTERVDSIFGLTCKNWTKPNRTALVSLSLIIIGLKTHAYYM